MTYRCPICAYDMPFPPKDDNICSCCGTEFGYDDVSKSHAQIAEEWIEKGAKWFSSYVHPPRNWNPWMQLIGGNLSYRVPWLANLRVSSTVSYVESVEPRTAKPWANELSSMLVNAK